MSDDSGGTKDKLAAWKKAANKAVGNKPQASAAESVMKKALALNPNLKGSLRTEEFLDQAASAQREHQQKRAEGPVAVADKPRAAEARVCQLKASDLATNFEKAKLFVVEQDGRISAALATANLDAAEVGSRQARLIEQTRARVVDLFSRVDPSLSSPRTQALIARQAGFLKLLQLDLDKLKQAAQRAAAQRAQKGNR